MKNKKVKGIFEKIPGSGIWWIEWYDSDHKRHREKAGRRSDALELYRTRKAEAWAGVKVPANIRSKGVLFKEIADDALAYSKKHKRDFYNDEIRMKRLTAYWGERKADSITHQEIDSHLDSISNSPATFNRWRALWSMMYREALRNKKVVANPAKFVRPRRVNNARTRYLTANEEAQLVKSIRKLCPRHLPDFLIALHTGMRRGEQFSLQWEQVNLKRRLVHLQMTKNGSERYVPINGIALAQFKKLRRGNGNEKQCTGPVFVTSRGEAIKNARTWFEDVIEDTGLSDVTWHTLRHTFASRLVMAGVDLRTVQELMGHKMLQMTVRYSHLAPSHTLSAVERLCGILEQQPPKQPPTKKAASKRAA